MDLENASAGFLPATYRPHLPPPTTRHQAHREKTGRPSMESSPPPVTTPRPRATSPPTTSPPTTSPPTTSPPSGTATRRRRTTSRRRRSTSRCRGSTSRRCGITSRRRRSTSLRRGTSSCRRGTSSSRRLDNTSPSHGSRRGVRIRPPRWSRHVEQRRVAEIQNIDVIARPLPRHELGGLPEQRSGGKRVEPPPGNRSDFLVQRAGTEFGRVGQILLLLVLGEAVEGVHVVEE